MKTGNIMAVCALVFESLATAFMVGAHSPYIRAGGYTKEGFWYRCYDDGFTKGCQAYAKWPLMTAIIIIACTTFGMHLTSTILLGVSMASCGPSIVQSTTLFILAVVFISAAIGFGALTVGLIIGNYDGHTRRYNAMVRDKFKQGGGQITMPVPFSIYFISNGGFQTNKAIAISNTNYEAWKQKYHVAFYAILFAMIFGITALALVSVAYNCCAQEWDK